MCEAGHAYLTDFNIAVRFRDDKPLTAVAGSMAYMAPEILAKKGYLSSIDWWSLGVIIYEMATAKVITHSHSDHLEPKPMKA